MNMKHLPIILTFGAVMLGVGLYLGQSVYKPESPVVAKVKPTLPETQILPVGKAEEIKQNNSLIYEYHLQLGAFKTPYFAQSLSQKVAKRGYTVKVRQEKVKGEMFTLVEVGPFKQYTQAKKHKMFLQKDNNTLGKVLIKKRIRD
jgi:cell division septation protein DedD